MARVHVLERSGINTYRIVIHTPVPGTGNNTVGVQWRVALANSGQNTTSMAIGTGPGQISQAEANQIASGAVMEIAGEWNDPGPDPDGGNDNRLASLGLTADQRVAEQTILMQEALRFFGGTVA